MEIRDDGNAAEVERVLAHAFVARLGPLDLVDAGERVLHGGAFAEARAALGPLLVGAQALQQRFLRMDRDGASAARGGRAAGA